jgi:ABC-2 type transport system permease protein
VRENLALIDAFIRRDWALARSYRIQFVFGLVVSVIGLALFFYLGRLVDTTEFSAENGLTGGYFGFAAVGLAALEVLRSCLSSFSRRLREDQMTGTLEALMATPASPSLVVLGTASYDMLMAAVDGFLVVVIAAVVFGLDLSLQPSSALLLVALPASLCLFMAIGVVLAALTIVYKQITSLLGLVVSVVALLGGVYYPISVLPEPLHTIAAAMPFTWALDVIRAALLGGDMPYDELAGLVVAGAVALPLSLLAFSAALTQARRAGTLAHY